MTVVDYLLNAAHPDNGGKAKFFEALGYSGADPSSLVGALKNIAVAGKVVERSESVHGEKYIVDGMLMSHTEQSRSRAVRTVWIVERSTDAPRLVTAYPRGGEN
jgi:hypothetical protein